MTLQHLLNLIRQELRAAAGLALLDPHGDLAEAVLAHVPRGRTADLVYLNPADAEWPMGFNPLARDPDDLKPVVADGVVSAFRHVWPDIRDAPQRTGRRRETIPKLMGHRHIGTTALYWKCQTRR
jgi:hypothetical protein